ncbi:hypothetical protein EVAR_30617_1 [Eumeta japonica]|uniref:Uncharacterized protein n=1 Tax=Eumeta variegata TaxID=151549 RepID=A0A4C1W836_EUMVA|nr:hypothetical protein EVAR_30617_1 [Eumeta japonica]
MNRGPTIGNLEQKLKIALLELNASKELCKSLMSERDNHKIEIGAICVEHYKHSLLQIQSLQAELHSNRMQTNKLQHEMDEYKVDETVKFCDSILNGDCCTLVNGGTGLTDVGRGRTVIYSEDLDVGSGAMLGVGQRQTSNENQNRLERGALADYEGSNSISSPKGPPSCVDYVMNSVGVLGKRHE